MTDYLLLMHVGTKPGADAWGPYIAKLREAGCFQGGSSMGEGVCVSRSGSAPDITRHLAGYLKIRATDLDHARTLLAGNPVYELGGVVEIRALPTD
jgi:hypothetical protein